MPGECDCETPGGRPECTELVPGESLNDTPGLPPPANKGSPGGFCYGARLLKSTRRHGHFLNLSGNMKPSDMRQGL